MRPKPKSVRALLLWAALGATAVAVALSYFAGVSSLASELRGTLSDEQIAALTRSLGLSLLAAGAISLGVAALLGLGAARKLDAAFRVLRHANAGGRAGTGFRELDAIGRSAAHALEVLADRAAQTERARAELAGVLDAVGEGILQIDAEARIVRVNHAAQRILRLPPKPAGERATLIVRKRELRRWLERGIAGEAVRPLEITIDDRRILVSIHPMPVQLEGQPEYRASWVVVFVDLTELRRLEDVRRDFVANASHELKTPLTSIRGYSETLLTDTLPADMQRQFLETIHKNAERLHRVVDDLLDLSRIESGRWQPRVERVPLADAAREAWTACAAKAKEKSVDLQIDDPESLTALGDAVAVGQIFANLFDNALRYSEAGGAIRVDVRPGAEHSANKVVIEVTDEGAGIPRDALGRIFERFYRVDSARSREEGGTGLGLSIVKHMVENMGGGVKAESELGRGTTIRFTLPAAG